jgi:hypothetical protein
MKALLSVFGVLLSFSLVQAPEAMAREAVAGDQIQVQDMTLTVPDGWRLRQDARDEGTIILGFEKGSEYVTLFVSQNAVDMRAMFVNGSTVVRDIRSAPRNTFDWRVLETSKTLSNPSRTTYVASFLATLNGNSYYGYGRGASSQTAMDNVNHFLNNLR